MEIDLRPGDGTLLPEPGDYNVIYSLINVLPLSRKVCVESTAVQTQGFHCLVSDSRSTSLPFMKM